MSKLDRLKEDAARAEEKVSGLVAEMYEIGPRVLKAALAGDKEAFLDGAMRRETLPIETNRAQSALADAELELVRERKREFQAQEDEARSRYEELQARIQVLTEAERKEFTEAEIAMSAVHENHIAPLVQAEADLVERQRMLGEGRAWLPRYDMVDPSMTDPV